MAAGGKSRAGTTCNTLFRGLRLKIGIDVGRVHANVNHVTGRMAYRGRVMNRAARVVDKAPSGHVWCSRAAWDVFCASPSKVAEDDDEETAVVDARPLGMYSLKGVPEQVHLMQCVLATRGRLLSED